MPRHRAERTQSTTMRTRRGAVIVEAAVVTAVLLVIVLGMLDYGLAVLRRNALSEAARRLAREVIVRGEMAPPEVTPLGPTAYSGTAANDDDIAAAVRPALVAMNPQQVAIEVQWPDGDHRVDQRVQVTLRYQHRSAVPLVLGLGPLELSAGSMMRIVH